MGNLSADRRRWRLPCAAPVGRLRSPCWSVSGRPTGGRAAHRLDKGDAPLAARAGDAHRLQRSAAGPAATPRAAVALDQGRRRARSAALVGRSGERTVRSRTPRKELPGVLEIHGGPHAAIRGRLLSRDPGPGGGRLRGFLFQPARQQGLWARALRGDRRPLGNRRLDRYSSRDRLHEEPPGGRSPADGRNGRQLRRLHDQLGHQPLPRLRRRDLRPRTEQPGQLFRQYRYRRAARDLLPWQFLGRGRGAFGNKVP